MATFAYQATNSAGKRLHGVVTADSSRAARDKLRSDGLKVESVTARSETEVGKKTSWGLGKRTRYAGRLTVAIRELATLLQAGIPLLQGLDSVIDQSRGPFRESLVVVRDRVAGGAGLAEAMASEPTVFDDMTVGLIRVGEHAGNLDEVCEQIAEFRERSGELRDRVLSALIYPIIVLGISIAVTLFLMTVVVPMLLTNLIELDRPLPWPTRVLKVISDTLLQHGWWMAICLGVMSAGGLIWVLTERGKRQSTKWLFAMPVAGTLAQRQAISRVALVISSLLRSGVELVDALRIAERASTNLLVRDALAAVREDLEVGRPMKESFARHRVFPATVAQVFSLGQQSGQLDKMLERLARDYDRQAAVIAGRLTSVVEPILILLLGVIVGFILFATMLPILEAGNVLSSP